MSRILLMSYWKKTKRTIPLPKTYYEYLISTKTDLGDLRLIRYPELENPSKTATERVLGASGTQGLGAKGYVEYRPTDVEYQPRGVKDSPTSKGPQAPEIPVKKTTPQTSVD